MRARLIADKHRQNASASAPTMVEIPSNPVARVNLAAKQEYDKTTLHRDYVVVRCDQNAAVYDPRMPDKDVRLAAEEHHIKRMNAIRAREDVLKALDKNALVRHEAAIQSIHMNKVLTDEYCYFSDSLF